MTKKIISELKGGDLFFVMGVPFMKLEYPIIETSETEIEGMRIEKKYNAITAEQAKPCYFDNNAYVMLEESARLVVEWSGKP